MYHLLYLPDYPLPSIQKEAADQWLWNDWAYQDEFPGSIDSTRGYARYYSTPAGKFHFDAPMSARHVAMHPHSLINCRQHLPQVPGGSCSWTKYTRCQLVRFLSSAAWPYHYSKAISCHYDKHHLYEDGTVRRTDRVKTLPTDIPDVPKLLLSHASSSQDQKPDPTHR